MYGKTEAEWIKYLSEESIFTYSEDAIANSIKHMETYLTNLLKKNGKLTKG